MKKRCLLAAFLLSLTFLCGCGIELTSKIKLNKNFSGTRIMSCTFSSNDFTRFFQGTEEDLDLLIKNSCPSQLSYKKSSRDSQKIYTFTLTFSSLKDYKEKTEAILNFAPEITYQYGDSPFVQGLIYKENFSSKDLMAWLYTALYEKKYVDKQSVDELWNLKETTISFSGKTYETEDKISIDEMQYAELSSIHIDTEVKRNGQLSRKIALYIPKKTLDQNSGKIQSYFDNENTTWSNWKDGKILIISFSEDNFMDLAAKTREIFHSKQWSGTYNVQCKSGNPFSFDYDYKESMDFSNFVQKSGTVPVTFTFNKKKILDSSVNTKTLQFSSRQKQQIINYNIITVWKSEKDIRRKISFTFDAGSNKRQLSKLKKAFSGKTISNVSLVKEDQMVLSMIQSGTVKDCNDDISSIFHDSFMNASVKNSFFRGNMTYFEDTIAFSSGSKQIHGTYTFVSVNHQQSVKVSVTPKKQVKSTISQNLSSRQASELIHSDETVRDLYQYQLTGDHFKVSYQGSSAASYWTSLLKIIIPLLFLAVTGIFIYVKQSWILMYAQKIKTIIENYIEKRK